VDAHPEAITDRFREAKQQGTLQRLDQTKLPGASDTVTIRIPQEELIRARHLAARRGLRYQLILKCCCTRRSKQKKRSSPARVGYSPMLSPQPPPPGVSMRRTAPALT